MPRIGDFCLCLALDGVPYVALPAALLSAGLAYSRPAAAAKLASASLLGSGLFFKAVPWPLKSTHGNAVWATAISGVVAGLVGAGATLGCCLGAPAGYLMHGHARKPPARFLPSWSCILHCLVATPMLAAAAGVIGAACGCAGRKG